MRKNTLLEKYYKNFDTKGTAKYQRGNPSLLTTDPSKFTSSKIIYPGISLQILGK